MKRLGLPLWAWCAASGLFGCYSDRIPERRLRIERPGPEGSGSGDAGTNHADASAATASDGGGRSSPDAASTVDAGANSCVLRVDVSVDVAAPNGASWDSAFAALSDAVVYRDDEQLGACDLWVAEGSYALPSGLELQSFRLLGGFEGDEIADSERNPEAHRVVLDGGGTAPAVVTFTSDGLLDGVVVTGGELGISIDGGEVSLRAVEVMLNAPVGGAVVESGSLNVAASRFFQNENEDASGGGAIRTKSGTHLLVEDSVFANNGAVGADTNELRQGGALFLLGATAAVRRSWFVGNESATTGGAISAGFPDWSVTDSVFVGNRAPAGAAIQVGASGKAANCTLFANGAGAALEGEATVLNSIIWGNEQALAGEPTVLATVIEGGYDDPQSQVLTFDPEFVGVELTSQATAANPSEEGVTHVALDANLTQGAFERLFLEVQPGAASGASSFYWIVDNTATNLELLGGHDSGLSGRNVLVHDLHLASGSPSIDRAWGTTAQHDVSGADIEGNARRDDPAVSDGVVGEPTFVDLGAFER